MSKQTFTNKPFKCLTQYKGSTPSDTTLATQDDNKQLKSTTFWRRQSQKLKVSKLENPMIQYVYQLWKEPGCPPPTPSALNSRHLSSEVATFDFDVSIPTLCIYAFTKKHVKWAWKLFGKIDNIFFKFCHFHPPYSDGILQNIVIKASKRKPSFFSERCDSAKYDLSSLSFKKVPLFMKPQQRFKKLTVTVWRAQLSQLENKSGIWSFHGQSRHHSWECSWMARKVQWPLKANS